MLSLIIDNTILALEAEVGVTSTQFTTDLVPDIFPSELMPSDPSFCIGVTEEPETPVEDSAQIGLSYFPITRYRTKIMVMVKDTDRDAGRALRRKIVRRIKRGLYRDGGMDNFLIFVDTSDGITERIKKYSLLRCEYLTGKGDAAWHFVGILYVEFESEFVFI